MNISPDIFRPPTAPNKHSTVIREWFHSSHSNRLDLLQTDPEVTGLLCFNDGLFTTLDGLRVNRCVRPSSLSAPHASAKKVVTGAVGKPSNFQLFSLSAKVATSNFYSFLPLKSDGNSEVPLPVGPSLQNHLGRVAEKDKLKELVPVDLDKVDVACIYLPLAIPLLKEDFVPEGGPESPETVETVSALHPFAKVWADSIVKSKFLLSSRAHPDIITEIMPHMGHEMPSKCSPETELTLVRKGPIKDTFVDWAAGMLALNSKTSSPPPPPTSNFVTNNLATSKSLPSAPSTSPSAPLVPSIITIPRPTTHNIHTTLPTLQQSVASKHGGEDSDPVSAASPTVLKGKFSKLVAMIHLLFAVPVLDAAGNVVQLDPPTLTEDFLAAVEECSSTKELSREMMKILDANIQESEGKSRDFLLRSVDPPSINHALMSYFIGGCFPSSGFSKNLEIIKSAFTIFAWTPPPTDNKSYQDHLRATTNNVADELLEQPETKQALVERKFFVGGRQEKLDDVLSTIGNFFQFALSLVTFDMANPSTYPLILFRMSEFAEFVYDNQFKSLHDKHLPSMPWLPHTLLTYLQKYFQACTPAATKPKNIRAIINGEAINPKVFKDAEFLLPRFMDMLRTCVIGDNMGMLTAPPASYQLFFPSPKITKRKPEEASTVDDRRPPKAPRTNRAQDNFTPASVPRSSAPSGPRGFLNNSGEKVLPPTTRMTVNPCYEYLVDGVCSHQGCRFFHGIFPKDYTTPDKIVMRDWVAGTPALSWKPAAKSALDRSQASRS